MNLFRRFRYPLLFLAVLLFCSVMIVRQFQSAVSRHVERREAFILLFVKGYRTEAQRLYERLLSEVPTMSNTQLMDDFQRTLQVAVLNGRDIGEILVALRGVVVQPAHNLQHACVAHEHSGLTIDYCYTIYCGAELRLKRRRTRILGAAAIGHIVRRGRRVSAAGACLHNRKRRLLMTHGADRV